MSFHENTMRRAIELSIRNVENGGGPFAAVIVRDGKVFAEAVNTVIDDHDPTAHAEVNAIRKAAGLAGDFHLENCVLYTTCEPCPMCLGAIYWAGIPEVYYANNRDDAEQYGFQDRHIYEEARKSLDQRSIRFERLLGDEAIEAFKRWDEKSDKIFY
jgi:tRNA(Arg) A34 adenosine deaminase TadA